MQQFLLRIQRLITSVMIGGRRIYSRKSNVFAGCGRWSQHENFCEAGFKG
jgi:hypothetical protein